MAPYAIMFEGRVLNVSEGDKEPYVEKIASPHSQYTEPISQGDLELITMAMSQGRRVSNGVLGGWEISKPRK